MTDLRRGAHRAAERRAQQPVADTDDPVLQALQRSDGGDDGRGGQCQALLGGDEQNRRSERTTSASLLGHR